MLGLGEGQTILDRCFIAFVIITYLYLIALCTGACSDLSKHPAHAQCNYFGGAGFAHGLHGQDISYTEYSVILADIE
jgi:hypothetical protein